MPRSQKSAVVIHKPAPVPAIIPQKPSFVQTVKEGFSFGVGSSIAHNIVNRMFASSEQKTQKLTPTLVQAREYEQCLAEHSDFVDSSSYCAHLLRPKGDKT